jgi:hypothetical protein
LVIFAPFRLPDLRFAIWGGFWESSSGLTARTAVFFLLCDFFRQVIIVIIIVTMIIIYAVRARVVEVFVVGSRVVSHVICTGFM